jgi:hypothetical protein
MKRWPIIRHVRCLIPVLEGRAALLEPVHRHLDDQVLDAVWRGER